MILIFKYNNFLFLDRDGPCSFTYCVYVSHLISFVIVCSNVSDTKNNGIDC